MGLWTPPSVSRDLAAEAEQDAASVRLAAALRGQLDWWNRELKLIDQRLEMVWFDEGVDIVGVVPNRYHVIRWNDAPAPPSLIPVVGPEGEFVEPNSALFDKLRAGDMWNGEARREQEKRQRRAEDARNRQMAREAEERQAEILERWIAATRTQVSMSSDTPWTQNMSPASRRERARKQAKKA